MPDGSSSPSFLSADILLSCSDLTPSPWVCFPATVAPEQESCAQPSPGVAQPLLLPSSGGHISKLNTLLSALEKEQAGLFLSVVRAALQPWFGVKQK